MLYEVLRYLRNFFPGMRWYVSNLQIGKDGFAFEELKAGQYVLIEGSRYNDGIHIFGEEIWEKESFSGYITELRIPKEVINISAEIENWIAKNAEAMASIHDSESFGGASFTMAKNASGARIGWQDAFRSRLAVWKKL